MIYIIGSDRNRIQELITSLVTRAGLYATSSAVFGAGLSGPAEVLDMASSVMSTVSLVVVLSGPVGPTTTEEIRLARKL